MLIFTTSMPLSVENHGGR